MRGLTVILGSGVMAGQIGAYLLGRDMAVAWVSASAERRERLRKLAHRTLRRLAGAGGAPLPPHRAQVLVPGEPPVGEIACVIEATRESLDTKQAAVAAVERFLLSDTLLLSTSSSILPATIHPMCVGMHFFAPVVLCGFAELIVEQGRPRELVTRAREFAAAAGIATVEQDERAAFAVNRLLLPLQNEALLALAGGVPAEQVDLATDVFGVGAGQLALMDRVGFDTVMAAVTAYRSRMSAAEAAAFAPLADGLASLYALGKRGATTGDGFLVGAPLPARAGVMDEAAMNEFALRCRGLAANQALAFERDGILDRSTADTVWRGVFFCDRTLTQWLEESSMRACALALARAYETTRRSYFAPVGRLAELI